ncbi:MAG: PulJ/GspJ family protein [Planctomycetota bacterium]|jgi:prepilin-type N-terminal cleavage/methylation domain-containing protein
MNALRRSAARARSGFTLLEVLVATAIVGIAFVAVTDAMSAATSSKRELDNPPFSATQLAREMHMLAKTLPRDPSGSVGAKVAADVQALDSLAGASFSPPLRADLTELPTMSGWKQEVALEVYALGDLTTPTLEDPTDAFGPHSDRLLKLIVTVKEGTEVQDAREWWITP